MIGFMVMAGLHYKGFCNVSSVVELEWDCDGWFIVSFCSFSTIPHLIIRYIVDIIIMHGRRLRRRRSDHIYGIHTHSDIIFCLQANVVGAEVHHKSNVLANTVHESLL
mgnify:CR=1 FL=1